MNIPTAQEKRTQFNNLQTEAGQRLTFKVEKAIQEATTSEIKVSLDPRDSDEMVNIVIANLEKLGYRAYVFRSHAPDYDVYLVIEF